MSRYNHCHECQGDRADVCVFHKPHWKIEYFRDTSECKLFKPIPKEVVDGDKSDDTKRNDDIKGSENTPNTQG